MGRKICWGFWRQTWLNLTVNLVWAERSQGWALLCCVVHQRQHIEEWMLCVREGGASVNSIEWPRSSQAHHCSFPEDNAHVDMLHTPEESRHKPIQLSRRNDLSLTIEQFRPNVLNLYLHIEPQQRVFFFRKLRYNALKFYQKTEFSATSLFYKTRCIYGSSEMAQWDFKSTCHKNQLKPSNPWWKERELTPENCLTSSTRPVAFLCVRHTYTKILKEIHLCISYCTHSRKCLFFFYVNHYCLLFHWYHHANHYISTVSLRKEPLCLSKFLL